MLSNIGLEKDFWAEAVNLASYLVNWPPHRALNEKVPKEIWSGNSPNYFDLRVFDYLAYAQVSQGKLEPRAVRCIFLGFVASVKGFKLWCLEINKTILNMKTAFLHDDLEEDIYMQQPEVFRIKSKEDHVCLLQKSLSFIYLLLYVDDMLIAAKDSSKINQLKIMLNSKFEIKDLTVAKKILGTKISKDRHFERIFFSQKMYIEMILERFEMKISKPISIPFILLASESPQTKNEEKYISLIPYSSAVGSLMYAMVCTRLDISHVSFVSRYMARPKLHWQSVKWILKYLRGTSNTHLGFRRSSKVLVGFVDSDYASDLDKRRSLTSYLFVFGKCAISWKVMLQAIVTLLTTEAEYMTIIEAVKETI
ncbi:Retrovirus-related Pol polyprotein from transposon TNT 1-94 [Gossypium australe]|uniref:Retrovirus-related Pol polyprotein from transposon TNT 1-94 n=1 Tax=Gossypium australe TaxID=47621 RepID=A0A5B6WV82_9ROSI|nr:Retrovirus-related Pol polyprotein from transposon TNT 1-94 [Gossypium australe]